MELKRMWERVRLRIGFWFGKIGNTIKQFVCSRWKIQRKPYIDLPINKKKDDQIGVSVYVKKIGQAIKSGAEVIAITSDFGTGKSSLISLLKRKWMFKKWLPLMTKYKFTTINLWGFIKQDNVIEIHKNFIYQFVSHLNSKSGSHLSKKMSKNFGVLRVGLGNRKATMGVFCATVFLLLAEIIRRYPEESLKWIQMFLPKVSEITLNNCSALLYFLFAGIFFSVITRTDIVFSSPKSEGKREIDENVIIDYYRMQVLNKGRNKHYIVIIEDLDRIENPQMVFDFLIELRKYYIPENNKKVTLIRKNKVTFILCIKPAAQLHKEMNAWLNKNEMKDYVDISEVQEKYSKIFDLIIQLKKINIDNYDAILDGLLMKKRRYLLDNGLAKTDKAGKIVPATIDGIQWIIRGENLSIREIKQRLNDAFILHEVLTHKFDAKKICFEKCIIASYLTNAYPADMLFIHDNTFDNCIDTCLKKERLYDAILHGCSPEFVYEIQNFVERRQIESDYRVYFYNYPKGSNLYNTFESKVMRTILYDLEPEEDFNTILLLCSDEVIKTAIKKLVGLKIPLSKASLRYDRIVRIISNSYPEKIVEYARVCLSYTEHEITPTKIEIKNILKILLERIPENQEIIDGLVDIWNLHIPKKSVLEIRSMLCKNYKQHIMLFKKLFMELNPLITVGEAKRLIKGNVKQVMELINYSSYMFDIQFFDLMHALLIKENFDSDLVRNFYIQAYGLIDKRTVIDKLLLILKKEKSIPEDIENILLDAVMEGVCSKEEYISLLDEKPLNKKSILNLHDMVWNEGLSLKLCTALYEKGYLVDYIINMSLNNINEINFKDADIGDTILKCVDEILQRSQDAFKKARLRILELKLENRYITLFREPYEGIDEKELEIIDDADRAIELLSQNEMKVSVASVTNYFNKDYQGPRKSAKIIDFLYDIYGAAKFLELFYELDMNNICFRKMSKANKDRIIEKFTRIGMVKTLAQKLRFMEFIKYLVEDFEKELQGKAEYELEYVRIINIVDAPTRQTINNIKRFRQLHIFGDKVNQKLLKEKMYKEYIYSDSLNKKRFIMPKEPEMIAIAEEIFKANQYEELIKLQCDNQEFMDYMVQKEVYRENAMIRRRFVVMNQSSEMLNNLFSSTNDAEIITYLCKIKGFQDDDTAEKYIMLLEKKHNVLKNQDVYEHTYHIIRNPSIKRKYTLMRNAIVQK